MRTESLAVDFCVVGGGVAGLCAAVAAARGGARVALIQDRPVLGGNASSEVRMHICGAHGPNMRETGIVEEIRLENAWRNPTANYSIWDSVLYGIARDEPNLALLLNCSVNRAEMEGERIASVTGWQLTSETWWTVRAAFFADCSGDGILAPLTGAAFRQGREASGEFDEDIEPPEADDKTMGMTCLIQMRETDSPQPFTPPSWARVFPSDEAFPHRGHDICKTNFWWMELGGVCDSIHDTESLRDELLALAFGVIDHLKNHGDHGAENWKVEWIGFLPGKRESRRFEGDHILNQNDVRAEGKFADLVAYGGWSMDDHHPEGFNHPGEPTVFHPAPSPYGIPYRSLYSRNIENLFFAGRNISATHAAMSSTRVMATCAVMGQAVGTAAALALREQTSPRGVYEHHLETLRQTLLRDDAYLPWAVREVTPLTASATLSASAGDPEPIRNGVDRPVGDRHNGWTGTVGGWIEQRFDSPRAVESVRLVFDSDLDEFALRMPSSYPLDMPRRMPPATLVKNARIDADDGSGTWQTVATLGGNYQRLVNLPCVTRAVALRLVIEETWGTDSPTVFAWDVVG